MYGPFAFFPRRLHLGLHGDSKGNPLARRVSLARQSLTARQAGWMRSNWFFRALGGNRLVAASRLAEDH